MDSVTDSIDFFYINGSLLVHEPYPAICGLISPAAIFQRDKMLLIECPDRLFESFLATAE